MDNLLGKFREHGDTPPQVRVAFVFQHQPVPPFLLLLLPDISTFEETRWESLPGDVTDFDRVHLYFFQVLSEYRHDNLFLSLSLQIYPMRTYSPYLAIFRYIWPWHAMIAMASFL